MKQVQKENYYMSIVASGSITLVDLNDAKQLAMYIGASQSRTIIFNGASTYVPNYATAGTNQVLTPQMFIAGTATDIAGQATSIRWFYQSNGTGTPIEITADTTDFTLATTGVKTLTIKSNVLASRTSMTLICEATYLDTTTNFQVTSKAEIEIIKVTNGTSGVNAVSAVLSNDADSVPSDSAGNNQIVTGVVATVTVYEGASDVTASWSMGTPVVTGATGTLSGTPANRTWTLNANGMTADIATVTWTLTRSGYASIVKKFTISRIKAGVNGASPTLYRLIPSANAIQKNISNVYTPSTLTLNAMSQTGTGAYGAYAGRFIISETTDGTTYTVKYTSTANEALKVHTPSAGIRAIKVSLHLAGATPVAGNMLDEQVVTVVSDGATGADAVYAYVWNPEGNFTKNGEGTVKCHVDIFKGSTAVTGTAFKWYVQDPTATTASGGDADGGAGWRLLTTALPQGTSGMTTDTITVPASLIQGTEAFKVVATYAGVKYSGTTIVVDLSDPISVVVTGMDKFKNGEGTVTLSASVLRDGSELDSAGTIYTYAWSIYDASLVKTAFTKTGKTITVAASDISGRGNVVCIVSK